MVHPLAWLLIFAALGLGCGGCVKKPTMHVVGAEMTGVTFGFPLQVGALLTVDLAVFNPNRYDVGIRRVHGQTLLGGRHLVPVDFQPGGDGLWLPAQQTTRIRVPVTVPAQVGMAVLAESVGALQVPFRFTGRADVTAFRSLKIESDDWSVDEQGWITREQIVRALPGL